MTRSDFSFEGGMGKKTQQSMREREKERESVTVSSVVCSFCMVL